MKPYSYAFGDHTLFLRKGNESFEKLQYAWYWRRNGSLLHIYKGAKYDVNIVACRGGDLVRVFDFNEEIFRKFYRHYMPGTPMREADMDFNLAERYIAKLIRKRAKEQV